jgi:hypothetical protein
MKSKSASSNSLKVTPAPTQPGAMNITRILPLLYLIIDVYILVTLKGMNVDDYPCKCAVTTHVKKIINIIIAMIVSGLALMVLAIILFYYYMSSHNMSLLIPILLGGLFVVGLQIYYSYLLITYSNTLTDTKCECITSNFKTGIKVYGYFRIVLASLSALMLLFASVFAIVSAFRK